MQNCDSRLGKGGNILLRPRAKYARLAKTREISLKCLLACVLCSAITATASLNKSTYLIVNENDHPCSPQILGFVSHPRCIGWNCNF